MWLEFSNACPLSCRWFGKGVVSIGFALASELRRRYLMGQYSFSRTITNRERGKQRELIFRTLGFESKSVSWRDRGGGWRQPWCWWFVGSFSFQWYSRWILVQPKKGQCHSWGRLGGGCLHKNKIHRRHWDQGLNQAARLTSDLQFESLTYFALTQFIYFSGILRLQRL